MENGDLKVRDCVGCGFCCIKSPCGVARRIYPSLKTDCPKLKWDGSRYICHIYDRAIGPFKENIRDELSIGMGCCCNLNTWRQEIIPRRPKDSQEQLQKIELDPIFKKFLRAMSREMISFDKMILIIGGMTSYLEKEGKTKQEINKINKEIIYILKDRPKWIETFI